MFSGAKLLRVAARNQGQARTYASAMMRSGMSISTEDRMKAVRTRKEKPPPAPPARSLVEPIEETATDVDAAPPQEIGVLRSTTLSNGVRVVSLPNGQQAAGVGAFIKGGTAKEFGIPEMDGCGHLCEKLAFKSSARFPHEETLPYLEEIGAMGYGHAAKEDIRYCLEGPVEEMPKIAEIVIDTVMNCQFRPEEVEEQKEITQFFLSEEYTRTPDMWMQEEAHFVAFGDTPLGHRSVPTGEAVDRLTVESIQKFKQQTVIPENVVLATTGLDHEQFVAIAEKMVGDIPRSGKVAVDETAGESQGRRLYYPSDPQSASPYRGGYATLQDSRLEFFKQNNMTIPQNFKDHAGVVLAFEGAALTEVQDYYSMCILQSLMGAGASFSSGGPGKGMYSRTYRNVLNNYFVDNVFCFAMSYDTTGLFGLYLSGEQDRVGHMLELACINLAQMSEIGDEEFTRAKNQLKAGMFTRLETRAVQLEDLGLQKLVNDAYNDSSDHVAIIDSTTKEHVLEFVRRMLRSTPTVVLHGRQEELEKAHKMHEIQMFFVRNFGAQKTGHSQ